MESGARANAALAAAFDTAPDAIAVIEPGGGLRYFNEAFKCLHDLLPREKDREHGLRQNNPIDLPAFGGLKDLFSEVLKESRAKGFSTCRGELRFPHARQGSYIAALSSIPHTSDAVGPGNNRLFLLVIRETSALLNERIAALRKLFLLTGTETRVLTMFANGAQLSRIAQDLGVTIHTARAHMKALLSKTGCPRQAHLARLLETTPTGSIRIFI
jgi:DNA-binding CsgD family transcriptional regulator